MDSPCQPPQTLNTAKSCRSGSINSGPLARRWPVSQTEGRSKASSLTYSKNLWNGLFCTCNEDYSGRQLCRAAYDLFTKHIFSSHRVSFVSSEGVSYMTVCHCSLPIVKAFCFLEDLRWEFTACSNSAAIALADRPYLFLEFGEQGETYSCRFYALALYLFGICSFECYAPFYCNDLVILRQTGPFRSWSSSTTRAAALLWRWHW